MSIFINKHIIFRHSKLNIVLAILVLNELQIEISQQKC